MSVMRYATCSEITTSVLGFGCGSVMGRVGRRASLRAMAQAWDAGITLFDTARSYGYGEGEALLGEFLQGRRAQAIVVTKFGILPVRPAPWKRWAKPLVRGALRAAPGLRRQVRQRVAGQMSAGHFDPATLRQSLHQSLRELRTDYVDILLAHEAPASAMQREDLLAELAAVVREGKVRHTGVSAAAAGVAEYANCHAGVLRPELLWVLQYPAQSWPATAARMSATGMRLANHPLGGASRAEQTGTVLKALAGDPRIARELRDKLQGEPDQLVAEFWFGRALRDSHPHAIVTSMLQPAHLRANLAAIDRLRFSPEDLACLEARIGEAGIDPTAVLGVPH